MAPRVLRPNITKEDDSWKFTVPPNELVPRRPGFGKTIRFSGTQILFQMGQLSNNRVLQGDDPSKFILVSFSLPRYPDWTPREGSEHISKLFAAGLFVNNVQYRFYHHSNSQLKSRSCYMRQASSDEELDGRIYQLGDFGRIMNVAKRAKRIGLLYSESQVDFSLDPRFIQDIRDLESGDEVFSDGCGLISRSLAIQVSKRKKIIFRGVRYTPCVFQIRYLGYKGVLMLHPDIDRKNELKKRQGAGASSLTPEQQQYLHSGDADWSICLAQFRRSMKKFTATQSPTFSVVGYSQPYSFGRLNNEIIVLLSSLGVPSENFVKRQQDYFDWITQAEHDPIAAVDLLSAMGKFDIAERLLLDGMDTPTVRSAISSAQKSEVAAFKKDDGKDRSRIIVKQSRKIYGVCDPYRVLKEGEVHVKITSGRGGATALIHGDVLVVRNPCLHPGDCLKLRAVQHPLLSHLADCIVFASVARPDHHSAPSMSSGGDLDGDQYFVCWDPALVPSTVSEAYDYPPNKERTSTSISRKDLANHFANYNNASLGRVSKLHNLWAMAMPNGALCSECQELSALHSQCVDGAIVKPPERLTNPPKRAETEPPYITELLKKRAIAFSESFLSRTTREEGITSTPKESSMQLVLRLLQSRPVELALSEYELFTLAYRIALRDGLDHSSFFGHLDCGALTTSQKHSICFALNLSYDEYAHLWNSFLRSDLLSRADLYQRNLSRPFSLHRLYSSKSQGMGPFFRYLNMALQDYTRKILILKTDERFVLAIFMRGEIMWEDDTDVDENVVVCAFLPHSTSNFSNYIPCTTGYRLFCGPSRLQLYDKQIADSFVFMTVPPKASGSEVIVSVALGKISNRVKQNLGRVNRQGISGIELHVVSNRDTVAHQLFDLWFDHIPTENRVRRFDREPRPYRRYSLDEVDWDAEPRPADFLTTLFKRRLSKQKFLEVLSASIIMSQWQDVMSFAVRYHAEEEIFWLFEFVISQPAPLHRIAITMMVDMHPPLVYTLLHKFPPDPDTKEVAEELKGLVKPILSNLIRSANDFPFPVLVAMEKISGTIAKLPTVDYLDLLWLASLSVRAPQLVQEVLLVLDDSRVSLPDIPPVHVYLHKFGKGVAFDRAEEAADECPCNEDGRPRKQKTAPVKTTLKFVPGEPLQVKAVLRVDARTSIRLHSHVRLQAASHLELSVSTRDSDTIPPLLDAMVIQAAKGEITLEVLQPLPPELEEMDWNLYHAGITATSKAMMDALIRLAEKRSECCAFYHLLVGESSDHTISTTTPTSSNFSYGPDINDSQKLAIDSIDTPISLIWGPPGTGKTTVVVQILRKLIEEATEEGLKILMTASTHNAVDNVLERFIAENEAHNILPVAQILRVATDVSKVNKNLRSYTVDARVGGELNENNKLIKQAQKRLEEARLIFSTCAGAGLGILRKAEFDIALIDEASQVTEPCALIPLVKGVKRAILVGDHVQLRPTVKKLGKVLQFDMSLMERLYTGRETSSEISKTMLDTQYRFPQELATFPSREFYEGKLRSGLPNGLEKLRTLPDGNDFPWPRNAQNVPIPCVFVQCSVEEDMGGMSKCNHGQVDVVEAIIKLLKPRSNSNVAPLLVTNLSPYTHQIRELRHRLPDVPSFTVDSFQGRESDVIIFSAVRCNAQHDIGFLDDARRLNVMWTRARRGLIIVGDRETMESDQLWKRALNSCAVAEIQVPERHE